nr:MAG TPA: hypothetical protein [Caudoviricetes sp.]
MEQLTTSTAGERSIPETIRKVLTLQCRVMARLSMTFR